MPIWDVAADLTADASLGASADAFFTITAVLEGDASLDTEATKVWNVSADLDGDSTLYGNMSQLSPARAPTYNPVRPPARVAYTPAATPSLSITSPRRR